jgi:hypothetical protein
MVAIRSLNAGEYVSDLRRDQGWHGFEYPSLCKEKTPQRLKRYLGDRICCHLDYAGILRPEMILIQYQVPIFLRPTPDCFKCSSFLPKFRRFSLTTPPSSMPEYRDQRSACQGSFVLPPTPPLRPPPPALISTVILVFALHNRSA